MGSADEKTLMPGETISFILYASPISNFWGLIIYFITKSDFAGTALCMHSSTSDDECAILPACKTKKLHTSRRDAFKAVNDTAIAKVNYKTGAVAFIKKDYKRKDLKSKVVAKSDFEPKVALLK